MSDQDFNFNPPPRREAKAFEPPPWEQGQFDELARRKQAEQAKVEELAVEAGVIQAGAEDEAVAEVGPVGEAREPDAAKVTPVVSSNSRVNAAVQKEMAEPLDPRIPAMLIGLGNEDPPFGTGLWKVAVGAGATLGAVGALLMIWGAFAMAAARRTGVTGSLGGGILVAFGLVFIGIGGWMAFRTLRQQGVL